MAKPANTLYYGDNLSLLRDRAHFPDQFVDLVYLDPPFNSNQEYNLLFREHSGDAATEQVRAFTDTWRWNRGSQDLYDELTRRGDKVADLLVAFRQLFGANNMLAYLTMMAPRLVELHRVLKPTGSLYLHCDPTASHYLKLLLDAIFGPERFRNEIVWRRSGAHSDTKQGMRRCGRIHDVILFYTKSKDFSWNPIHLPYSEHHLTTEYRSETDEGKKFKQTDATAAKPGGNVEYEWRVKRPEGGQWEADLDDEWKDPKPGMEYRGVRPYRGRFWAYSLENMREFARKGELFHRSTGTPRIIHLQEKMPGVPLQDLWDDIGPARKPEWVGYPTQKPIELLDRIIRLSSNPGDLILDPFCGCGTAIAAAYPLDRRWVGIDITHLAIAVMRGRLYSLYRLEEGRDYAVYGDPTTVTAAEALFDKDPFEFQKWVVGVLCGFPVERKPGRDQGIDGRLNFQDAKEGAPPKKIIISVKGGKPKIDDLRALAGVVRREMATIGVLATLRDPTREMRKEADASEEYFSPMRPDKGYRSLQIITVEGLLAGDRIDMPPANVTHPTPKPMPLSKPTPTLF